MLSAFARLFMSGFGSPTPCLCCSLRPAIGEVEGGHPGVARLESVEQALDDAVGEGNGPDDAWAESSRTGSANTAGEPSEHAFAGCVPPSGWVLNKTVGAEPAS